MDITDVKLFKYIPSAEVILAGQTTDWNKETTLTLTFAEEEFLKPMLITFSESIVWAVTFKDSFVEVFSQNITGDSHNMMGKKASLLVYLGEEVPKILAIGKENEKPIINKSNLEYEDFEYINFQTYMLYKVPPNPNGVSRGKNKV